MPNAAAIYCRISSDPSGKQFGVRRQEKDCRALAKRKGWTVARVLVDDDVSAYVPGRRPAYGELLDAVKGGEVDAVVVWDLDRLHRHPRELEDFFEVCDVAGLTNLASVAGDVDLASSDGRLLARVMGAVGRKESDDKSRRLQRKHLELAERGLAHGGLRPYGYRFHKNGDGTELVVVPEEATVIREMAERLLAGETLRSIAADLGTRGVTGSQGRPFSTTAIRRVLLAGRVAGLREHQGQVVGDAGWEPILDRAVWERTRALLLDPARRRERPARRYVLTGFVFCAACGGRMKVHPSKRRGYAYDCAPRPGQIGCGRVSIVGPQFEELIVEAVLQRVASPALASAVDGTTTAGRADDADAAQEIATAEAKLEELAKAWAADEITRAEWLAARKGVESRRAAAMKRLARAHRKESLVPWQGNEEALREAWPEMPLHERRAVLSALVDRVTVRPVLRPGARFDPDRVDVEWRV